MAMIRFGCKFGVALGTYRQAEDIECCSFEAMDYNLWVDLVEPYITKLVETRIVVETYRFWRNS